MSDIQNAIESFAAQLVAVIEAETIARARSAVFAALGAESPGAKRRGRPPGDRQDNASPHMSGPTVAAKKPRKKGPVQLCPVPGCKNPAAPVFGMVCAKHKDIAKTKIRQFREARKAKKAGTEPAKDASRRPQNVSKVASKTLRRRPTKATKIRRPQRPKKVLPKKVASVVPPPAATAAAA